VQPAISQSVQRTATPADVQTIQNVQVQENSNQGGIQNNALPVTAFAPGSSADSFALWVALIIAVLIAAGAVWLWRSF
jgi:hypothetical protein